MVGQLRCGARGKIVQTSPVDYHGDAWMLVPLAAGTCLKMKLPDGRMVRWLCLSVNCMRKVVSTGCKEAGAGLPAIRVLLNDITLGLLHEPLQTILEQVETHYHRYILEQTSKSLLWQ